MYHKCATKKSQNSYQCFLHALHELMGKHSYHDITLPMIHQQVHSSRRTFYRYFSGKQECLCALMDQIITDSYDFSEQSSQTAEQQDSRTLSTLIYIYTNQSFYRRLLEDDLFALFLERVIICAKANGVFALRWMGAEDCPFPDEARRFYLSGFIALIQQWCESNFDKTPQQMEEILNCFLQRTQL